MKREIKFRAQRFDNKEWCFGSIVLIIDPTKTDNVYYNAFMHGGVNISPMVRVDIETVSQFTGLYDKNGKEIYEGDIIESIPYKSKEKCLSIVEWNTKNAKYYGSPHFNGEWIKDNKGMSRSPELFYLFEVVGNIYEHEHLLK